MHLDNRGTLVRALWQFQRLCQLHSDDEGWHNVQFDRLLDDADYRARIIQRARRSRISVLRQQADILQACLPDILGQHHDQRTDATPE